MDRGCSICSGAVWSVVLAYDHIADRNKVMRKSHSTSELILFQYHVLRHPCSSAHAKVLRRKTSYTESYRLPRYDTAILNVKNFPRVRLTPRKSRNRERTSLTNDTLIEVQSAPLCSNGAVVNLRPKFRSIHSAVHDLQAVQSRGALNISCPNLVSRLELSRQKVHVLYGRKCNPN